MPTGRRRPIRTPVAGPTRTCSRRSPVVADARKPLVWRASLASSGYPIRRRSPPRNEGGVVATQVEKSIEVEVPVRTAYDQWTQFEDFPQFMSGVDEVRQVGDSLMHWVAQIAGVRREWDAAVLEQVPDSKVAWAATTGATNAGAVYFQSLSPDRTLVRLNLEYEPEGLVEKVGDFLNVVQRQAEGDLERFKQFIESRGTATGGWRGAVNEAGTVGSPGVDAASASRGDSGKAGVSGTAVA